MIWRNIQTVFIFERHTFPSVLWFWDKERFLLSNHLRFSSWHTHAHANMQLSTCMDKLSLSAVVTTGAQTVVSTRLGRRGWWPMMSKLPRGTGADQRRHTSFSTFLLMHKKTGQGKVIWHHSTALSFGTLLISVTRSETPRHQSSADRGTNAIWLSSQAHLTISSS